MTFSVVIPSRSASNLIPCVDAARKYEPGARIIVVNDGIPDSAKIAPPLDRCEFISGIKPFVFARNVNRGIERALRVEQIDVTTHGDAEPQYLNVGDAGVCLLNDDALLQTPHGFSKLAQFASDHPEVGCVAPSTNITGQRLQWPSNRSPEGYRFVDTVPYVCVYIPRRTIERVGLLDERYCIDYGCEDLDHTTAMNRAGLKVAILYDVYVDHGSLHSSFRGDPKRPASFQKNLALYRAKLAYCNNTGEPFVAAVCRVGREGWNRYSREALNGNQ